MDLKRMRILLGPSRRRGEQLRQQVDFKQEDVEEAEEEVIKREKVIKRDVIGDPKIGTVVAWKRGLMDLRRMYRA